MSPRSSVYARRSLIVAWDVFAWLVALLAFSVVRYDFVLSDKRWGLSVAYVGAAIVLQILIGFRLHLYLGRSRVGSYEEVTTLGTIVAGIWASLGLLSVTSSGLLLPEGQRFSLGIALFLPPFAFLAMAAGRWTFRALRDRRKSVGPAEEGLPVIVYGAGDIGHQVARLVDREPDAPYTIVGFVDDNPAHRFLRIGRYRVLGPGSDLVDVARKHGAEGVIVAISKADPKLLADLNAACRGAGLTLVVVPPVREMIGGQMQLNQLREFNVVDLLGRRPIETDLAEIADLVNGKVVLVTGAGGSIGSELALQVHHLGPERLILLDRDESGLHSTHLQLYGNGLLDGDDVALCDIRDADALRLVFEHHRPEVVFHAAALKHLTALESHPAEGWKTNVIGTLNVLQCAADVDVEHFVNISTDKAADPSSVLGQTKLLAERLTAWFAADLDKPYVSVRFGNVLGSRGSVLYSFRAQIERGGPVTVTHPDVTRYFMTIPEACELVLQAGAIGKAGDVLVLDMGEPVKIYDVAQRLIEESRQHIEIIYTGLREGEKMHEVLLSRAEAGTQSEHPLITQVPVPRLDPIHVLFDDSDRGRIGEILRSQIPGRAQRATPADAPPPAETETTTPAPADKTHHGGQSLL
ncbi:MAG: polysaccharide biosynthesis protein [Actinobacteria bacterium]|nr:polysaccharide biosynthesis protein [Actinomycetota bacterium]